MSFFRKKKSKAPAPPPEDRGARPLPSAPGSDAYGQGMYAQQDTYDTVGPPDARASRTRAANFMEKPEDGWHHDERAMGVGLGVYFTYPVIYVGRIELPQSISGIQHDAQTEITREAIARCVDDSFPRNPGRRNLSNACARYGFGLSDPMMFDVKLSMSARGIIIAPLDDPDGIVGFFPMRNISLATGGENIDYDYVSFTARDKETGQRHSHVFDCGLHSDDVMTDLGQAFALAQELAAAAGSGAGNGSSYLDVVPDSVNEALAPPPGADALYADLESLQPVSNPMYGMNGAAGGGLYDSAAGGGQSYFDVVPNPPNPPPDDDDFETGYRDVVPEPQQTSQDSYMEVTTRDIVGHQMKNLIDQREALYDTAAGGQAPGQALAETLNQQERKPVPDEGQYLQAEWSAYDDAQVGNLVDVNDLRGKSKLRDVYGGDMAHYDVAQADGGAGGAGNAALYDTAVQNTATYDTAGSR